VFCVHTFFGRVSLCDAAQNEEFIQVSLPPARIEGQKMPTFESSRFAQQGQCTAFHLKRGGTYFNLWALNV
jgi:hypothetical protein